MAFDDTNTLNCIHKLPLIIIVNTLIVVQGIIIHFIAILDSFLTKID